MTARAAAYRLLQGTLRARRSVDDNFDDAVATLEPRDRAFVRLLVATCLRRLGQIDDVLKRFVTAPPPPAEDALRLGATQALFLDTPVHAAVSTTVELVKRKGQDRLIGLVNAVMRKVANEGKAALAGQDEARLNTPAWLLERWIAAFGEETALAISRGHMAEPPLDLTPRTAGFQIDGAVSLPTGTLRLKNGGRIEDLPGYADGVWWVQDAAAALPARILMAALGGTGRVVDLCAAPGGKTAQLAASGYAVAAVDLSKPRMEMLSANLKRLNLVADVVIADGKMWQPQAPVDGVLLDAPCSATGTIRRHPDLPAIKRLEDFTRFPEIQRALLANAAAMVKPGGALMYSVCALEPEEGEGVIEAFLAANATWRRRPMSHDAVGGEAQFITPKGDLRTLPSMWSEQGGLDGFYGALLERAA